MLIRLTVFGAPGGLPKYPLVLCGKYFYAKMMNIADLGYSSDANSEMRQVNLVFPAHFSPSDDNKKVCSSNQPLLGSKGDPKISPRHDFDAKMVIFYLETFWAHLVHLMVIADC